MLYCTANTCQHVPTIHAGMYHRYMLYCIPNTCQMVSAADASWLFGGILHGCGLGSLDSIADPPPPVNATDWRGSRQSSSNII